MISLYIGLGVLILLAAILILLSLRSGQSNQSNLELHRRSQRDFYRQRQSELRSDFESGLIDESQLNELSQDLDRQLVTESAEVEQTAISASKRSYILIMLIVIPVLCFALYDHLGYRHDIALQTLQKEIVSDGINDARWQRYQDIVERILAKRPHSGEHLVMMATLYRQQGDFAGALPYYQRLEQLYPQDADVLAQLAQARYLVAGRIVDEQTRSLLNRVVAIDPTQATALGVLGIDAFAQGNYNDALMYWQKLLLQLPPGSVEVGVISGGIAETKRRMAAAGELQAVDVSVSLAPDLGETPEGVLFVVAKSNDGNPMPIAALRSPLLTDQAWPITLQLTDADVIRQGMRLEDFSEFVLSAHISRAGTAIRRDGDWVGQPLLVELNEVAGPLNIAITSVQGD
ncbi:Formate-dependent nitrite reductase complex subunit NrfG [Zhongshania aliphaticivorans]|uniref:Formate-dependent nitrite reductase complex subunit NrfG n=1 Tax=Zhongshania aliphaticivorans TaxID=1470434 RepID=A0A5S9NE06_9GAMM|nr:c-type cytochrome biogenesis protein CcmI [Zhongshania aliphaticivorans]CAA0087813.1 Formate-dependent nitrite reductase complex subunit NrfG [Zhongshania aliphaticivorans]CAA0115497.1 Formate-dependent nitrite reductase complex subunit NrfG [Zhongshania aliphaticivorans]